MINLRKYLEEFYSINIIENNLQTSFRLGLIDDFFYGYKGFLAGFNFTYNEVDDVFLDNGDRDHGFFSSSLLIAEKSDFLGISHTNELYFAGVGDSNERILPSSVLWALDWLEKQHVDIIIMPIASRINDLTISSKIEEMSKKDIIFFAAGGNFFPEKIFFPASHENVISVGAMGFDKILLPECNRYPSLDLVVPGFNIPGFSSSGEIVYRSGSSIATVIAGGLCTLINWQDFNKNKNKFIINKINSFLRVGS